MSLPHRRRLGMRCDAGDIPIGSVSPLALRGMAPETGQEGLEDLEKSFRGPMEHATVCHFKAALGCPVHKMPGTRFAGSFRLLRDASRAQWAAANAEGKAEGSGKADDRDPAAKVWGIGGKEGAWRSGGFRGERRQAGTAHCVEMETPSVIGKGRRGETTNGDIRSTRGERTPWTRSGGQGRARGGGGGRATWSRVPPKLRLCRPSQPSSPCVCCSDK